MQVKTNTKQRRRDASVQGEDGEQVPGEICLDSISDTSLSRPVPPASTVFADCGYTGSEAPAGTLSREGMLPKDRARYHAKFTILALWAEKGLSSDSCLQWMSLSVLPETWLKR